MIVIPYWRGIETKRRCWNWDYETRHAYIREHLFSHFRSLSGCMPCGVFCCHRRYRQKLSNEAKGSDAHFKYLQVKLVNFFLSVWIVWITTAPPSALSRAVISLLLDCVSKMFSNLGSSVLCSYSWYLQFSQLFKLLVDNHIPQLWESLHLPVALVFFMFRWWTKSKWNQNAFME